MRSNTTRSLLALVASFCLSMVSYNVVQPDDMPVQHLEFEEMIIQPDMEVIEFDDYEIRPRSETVLMDEEVIIAQAQTVPPREDNGDTKGIDWDQNYAFWCATHPDDVICQSSEDFDEDEEGC